MLNAAELVELAVFERHSVGLQSKFKDEELNFEGKAVIKYLDEYVKYLKEKLKN